MPMKTALAKHHTARVTWLASPTVKLPEGAIGTPLFIRWTLRMYGVKTGSNNPASAIDVLPVKTGISDRLGVAFILEHPRSSLSTPKSRQRISPKDRPRTATPASRSYTTTCLSSGDVFDSRRSIDIQPFHMDLVRIAARKPDWKGEVEKMFSDRFMSSPTPLPRVALLGGTEVDQNGLDAAPRLTCPPQWLPYRKGTVPLTRRFHLVPAEG